METDESVYIHLRSVALKGQISSCRFKKRIVATAGGVFAPRHHP